MPRKFAEIAFTPSVKEVQERFGARERMSRFETIDDPRDALTDHEAMFIQARDFFYQATAAETGWPYVQFKGGPPGFLRIIDEKTLGYADFRGNVQYVSVGYIGANDKVILFFMDYAAQRRLKVWARARVVELDDDPKLIEKLTIPGYRAPIERAILFHIEAYDWNCPKHITPRYTEQQIAEWAAPMQARLNDLEESLARGSLTDMDDDEPLGNGELELEITGIRQLTPEVRAYELRRPDGSDLPAVTPGAHLEVPIPMDHDERGVRYYSVATNAARRDAYEIAVRRDMEGDGGSNSIHTRFHLGMRINAGMPKNAFELGDHDSPAILIAGGIGITPLKPMAQSRLAAGKTIHMHYAARSRALMAYRNKLEMALGDNLTLYAGDEDQRMDIAEILSSAPDDAVFYLCGPDRLINDVVEKATELGIAEDRVRFERFSAPTGKPGDTAFQVQFKSNYMLVGVEADQTILDAVLSTGNKIDYSCQSGSCGTCAVKVLEGEVDHRDTALSDAEREAGMMCTCVSRAKGERLVLDL